MNTKLIPKVARHFEELESTNNAVIRALNAGEEIVNGAVFISDAQTAGRGQGTNHWFASPGANLTLSMAAYPDHLSVSRLFALNQLSGLAVADTVKKFLPEGLAAGVRLKWPNDVYVGQQKIAGILVQNGLRGSSVSWSVIGIGLNVNENSFPESLQQSATSLALLTGHNFNLQEVLAFLLERLAANYQLISPDLLRELNERYHQELYRLNVPARYQLTEGGENFFAVLRGVNEAGQLRLELAEGGERVFSLREVRFV
ncbi:biotin--[acetyl-CoA-carboxylase] ligase [Neolewinella aurantiaca]|uniref:biotin--[acetyl-CoA-carboxylase] ligase n=1 Tax=Neolewinella aurantiaca TaxID=2602767 RepID=UPI0016509AF2|nr:biotin--[acetyl-CoA-carboxylase] ligase [Neolewinella aurantiaca]